MNAIDSHQPPYALCQDKRRISVELESKRLKSFRFLNSLETLLTNQYVWKTVLYGKFCLIEGEIKETNLMVAGGGEWWRRRPQPPTTTTDLGFITSQPPTSNHRSMFHNTTPRVAYRFLQFVLPIVSQHTRGRSH